MSGKRKLAIGDKVRARFLGGVVQCTVIEVMPNSSYKLRMADGIIIPNCFWKDEADRKSPWYIEDFLGNTGESKSAVYQNTKKHTSDKTELDAAIKKQRKFIRGKHSKD
jgi:hypothetical protein